MPRRIALIRMGWVSARTCVLECIGHSVRRRVGRRGCGRRSKNPKALRRLSRVSMDGAGRWIDVVGGGIWGMVSVEVDGEGLELVLRDE